MGEDDSNFDYDSEDLSYSSSNDDFNSENNNAVMRNFFNTEDFLYKLEMQWKGFTLHNTKWVKLNKPIAPDGFINEMVGAFRSVINQHTSVSFINKEKANMILLEKFISFSESVLEEPFFQEDRYTMIKEEFDHALELFMGLVIKGHGTHVATSLQAGVVSEMNNHKNSEKSVGLLTKAKNLINKDE